MVTQSERCFQYRWLPYGEDDGSTSSVLLNPG
jgi:hypothetical protein